MRCEVESFSYGEGCFPSPPANSEGADGGP